MDEITRVKIARIEQRHGHALIKLVPEDTALKQIPIGMIFSVDHNPKPGGFFLTYEDGRHGYENPPQT